MIIINKGKELIKKQKDELSPSYINLKNPRYMEIDGKYCSSLLVVDYSREQRDLIFKPLIDTNININMSIFYEEQADNALKLMKDDIKSIEKFNKLINDKIEVYILDKVFLITVFI